MPGLRSGSMLIVLLTSMTQATAQVTLDVDNDRVRRAAGDTYLEDLAVNDTAMFHTGNFCISDAKLYMPGWAEPSDLANQTYAASTIMIKATLLPGRRIKAVFVDGAQAQSVAKGNTNASPTLSQGDLHKAIRQWISNLYQGGGFYTDLCDQLAAQNPMRPMTLYPVETLNSYVAISELLKSVGE